MTRNRWSILAGVVLAGSFAGRASSQTYVEVTPGAAGVSASTADVNVPANVVDGDLATRWSGNGDGAWLQLDLGSAQAVGFVNVAVHSGNTRRNQFEVQISTNGTAWTTVWSGASSGTTTALETYDFDDVTARWVRYLGHSATLNAGGTTTWNSVSEIEVFAQSAAVTPTPTPTATPTSTPTPTPGGTYSELTPGAAGVSANTNDGNVPGNTVDGSLATRWSGNGDGAWIQYDLGAVQTIGFVNIAVYNGNGRQNRFDLQVANSAAGPWTNVLTNALTTGTTTALETYDFADASGRFVRYLGHMSTVGSFNSLTEVEVWGIACSDCTPTPTETPTPTLTPTITPTPTPTPSSMPLQGKRGALYTPPTNTFFMTPGDSAVTINDTSGSIASVQTAINNARSSNPSAVIVARLMSGGTYTVSGTGLVLGSRVCLVAEGATLRAASSSVSATFLVQVASGATHVSVAGGTFDGSGADLNGIVAPLANRVNIDKVTVVNTGREAIRLTGHGATVFDNEFTVTRADVSGSGVAGISVHNATQALLIDNHAHDNPIGIRMASSARSSIVNNVGSNNGTGIEAGGNDNVIANNTCDGNIVGIDAVGTNNVLASNSLGANTTAGIRSSGSSSTFTDNLFTAGNATRFVSGGTGNHVVAYKGALSASGQNYFYPPLVSDPHTTATIVNGRGRFDLTIGSTSLSNVQTQYNSARSAHPNDHIVLHLTGTYTVGASPLTLSSNTSILLTGTIQVNSSTTAGSVISSANTSSISISGGIIDGAGRTGRRGIHFSACRMTQIDAVNIRNFGPSLPRSGAGQLVHIAGGGFNGTPHVMTRNVLNGGSARGVWSQLSGAKAIYTDNRISNVNMDAIDLDSHTNAAVVKFNTLTNNVRAGIFIEEGARWNQCFGNVATGSQGDRPDGGNGLWVWANATGPTEQNTYFCNRSEGNKRNLSCGTFDQITTQSTENNFIFNNILRNGTNGLVSQPNGTQNYYSQNIVTGNSTNYGSLASAVFFNSADVP
jgi:parallel beta-helix repeat protein